MLEPLGWRYAVQRVATLLLFANVLLVLLSASARAQSGPEPGATDPVGKPAHYDLFPSSDLFVPALQLFNNTALNNYTYFHDPNDNVSGTSPIQNAGDNADSSYSTEIFPTAGRFTSAEYGQILYARRDNGNVALLFNPHTANDAPQLSYTLSNLAPRLSNHMPNYGATTDLIDIAASDIDKVTDSAGNRHDEAVVVYASPAPNNMLTVNLAVLDYGSPQTATTMQPIAVTTATASTQIDADTDGQLFGLLMSDNMVTVALGDYDGDGYDEIAIAYFINGYTAVIDTFRYRRNANTRTLTLETTLQQPFSNVFQGSNGYIGSISAAAGDLNGDGTDELVLSHGEWTFGQPNLFNTGYIRVYSGDANLNLAKTLETQGFDQIDTSPTDGYPEQFERFDVVTGLFQFDLQTGDNFGERQIAFAWNDTNGNVWVQFLSLSQDLQQATQINLFEITGWQVSQTWSLTAGKFNGNTSPTAVTWQVAVGGITPPPPNINQPFPATNFAIVDPTNGIVNQGNLYNTWSGSEEAFSQVRLPLMAYDYDGLSFYLGAPVHFTINETLNTDFILQEPPKHTYYDNNPNSPTYGQIVNISRFDNFNLALVDSNQTTFSSQSTDTTNWSIGGSVAASASATVQEGENFSLFKDEGSIGISATVKVGYQYNSQKSSYNSQYGSRTVAFSGVTDHDDYVTGRIQTTDLWRYRVFGFDLANTGHNPFYDLVLPGPTLDFAGGGSTFDWYQPIQENGNALSYPLGQTSNPADPYTPPDVGSFTLPDNTVVNAPMIPASLYAWDGTSGSLALSYSSQSGSGSSRSYQHTLSESADVQVSYSADADFFGDGGDFSASVETTFNNSNSWGGLATSNSTTNETTGITLNKTSGNAAQGYLFYPVFYVATDGTVKATHAVDVLGDATGQQFWASLYGAKPDPALNLPNRFNTNYETCETRCPDWVPNTLLSRKQLRGFFITASEPNTVTNQYEPLTYIPLAGDTVRTVVRVYNYSTGQSFNNLQVQFRAVPYNPQTGQETQPGTVIGTTTVPQLNAQGMTEAIFNWNTSGFASGPSCTVSYYHIYIDLDPNNSISELYEPENPNQNYPWVDVNGKAHTLKGIDPGQNNEGYGSAAVMQPNAQNTCTLKPINNDVSLKPDSIALAKKNHKFKTVNGSARVEKPRQLRITVYSDKKHRAQTHLLVYDGDPNQGGALIADKFVHSGNPKGANVWIDWLPHRAGLHEIHAIVMHDGSDPRPDNNHDVLKINVKPCVTRRSSNCSSGPPPPNE